MARGDVFGFLRLVEIDKEGREVAEVPEPFREVELWDETFTRMTLWLHPGRQKPGVNLNFDIGPILEQGKRYRLEVAPDWEFEDGQGITGEDKDAVHFEFVAGPMDDEQPKPANWTVEWLERRFIEIQTGEAVDPVSASKRIAFIHESGAQVKVLDVLAESERVVVYSEDWKAGKYRMIIDPALEDLAGNSIARPFNLNLEKDPSFKERTESVTVEFELSEFSR